MRFSFLSTLLLTIAINASFSQSYIWNDYLSGSYATDYEANRKKLIDPNANFSVIDFEIDEIAQMLMILTNNGIQVLNLEGDFVRFIPINQWAEERSLELDPIRRKIYVIFGSRILRLDYDGSNLIQLYDDNTTYIDDLGIDPYRNKMYWRTGFEYEVIKQSNLDGSNVSIIFSGPDIRDMQFDAIENTIYFKNISEDKIEKLDLNNNNRSVLYSFPNSTDYVWSMEVDVEDQILYFQTSSPFQFFKYDLTTGTQEELFNVGHSMNIIKPYFNNLFLNIDSYSGNRIVSLDLNSNEIVEIVKREEYLNQFVVDEENERWIGITTLSSIQSANMFGDFTHEHKPKGIDNLRDIIVVDSVLVLLDGRRLYSTDLQFKNLKLLTSLEELSPRAITHNPNDNKIYIVNRWKGNVYRCNIDGSQHEVFLELDSILNRQYSFTDIVFSPYNNKFYLTSADDILLVQMDEDGTNLVTLESGNFDDGLSELALDQTGKILYYRSAKLNKVFQLDVDTKEITTYADDIPDGIHGLHFHPTQGSLYAISGTERSIYKFVNGVAVMEHQESSDINLGYGFTIDSEGNFYASLNSDYQSIRRFSSTLSSSSSHLNRNFRYGGRLTYYPEDNELWGMVKSTNSGSNGKPFRLNLDTDVMTYYPEIGENDDVLIIPQHKMIYWIEDRSRQSIIRNDLTTGLIDTILFVNDFRRYNSLIYNPANERVYFSRTDATLRLQSTDVFGNDSRIENYDYPIYTMVAVNPVDSTLTMIEDYSDARINRWNFITGQFVSHGEEGDRVFKRSWNLVSSYYENIDEDEDGFSFLEDCDDSQAQINPNAVEIPDNDIDENCDGLFGFTDQDNDGVPLAFDCDDQDSLIHIYAPEIPNNNIDENCDGIAQIIDVDGDGYNSDEDCNDQNPDVNPGQMEIVGNGIDDNCDGLIDEISGVHELGEAKILVYPNPTNQYIYILKEGAANLKVKLYNEIGQLIYNKNNIGRIDISQLTSGIYLLDLEDQLSGGKVIEKIIIIN